MAKYNPLPKTLKEANRYFIQNLIAATEQEFPKDLGLPGESNRPLDEPYTTADGKYHWSTNKDLLVYVTDLTETHDIRTANRVLYQTLSTAPEYSSPTMMKTPENIEGNSLQKGIRESQEIERANREAKIKASIQKAKNDVKAEIDRQKKLADEVNKYKIYKQTKNTEAVKLTEKQLQALETIKKASPQQLESIIYNRLKNNTASGTTDKEIELMAIQASISLAKTLRGQSLAEEIAIANHLSKNTEILNRAGVSNQIATEIKNTADRVVAHEALEYQFNRRVISASLGESIAQSYGPSNLDKIQVTISPANFEGAESFNVSDISSDYSNILNDQNVFLDSIRGFGEKEIKDRFISHLVLYAEKSLPEEFLKSAVSNQAIQAALDIYGISLGESIVWEGTTLFGRIAVGTGYGEILGWLGSFTGIDFGVSAVLPTMAAETTGEIITTGAIYTTETLMTLGSTGASTIMGAEIGVITGAVEGGVAAGVTTAAIDTAAVATAPATGGLSLVLAAVATVATAVVGPKIIGAIKDNLHKAKDFIVMGLTTALGGGIGFATGFGFIGGGLFGLAAGWGFTKVKSQGVSGLRASANIGARNIMNAGWVIGTTALEGIAGPLLITLLAFPIVIVLILFIINSGAYIVPPSPVSLGDQNEYISVVKEASPTGPFNNTDLPLKIKYTITVVAKKETLTNVQIKDNCQVITKTGTQECSAQVIQVPDGTIKVGNPFTFSYEVNYNTTYKDSLVTNTATITANVISETNKQTALGSTSLVIGNPPTECFKFDKTWEHEQTGLKNVALAINKMSQAKTYMATLCGGGSINLTYSHTPVAYGGEIINGGITLYKPGVYLNDLVTLYTLAHESGHIYAHRTSVDEKFEDDKGVRNEGFLCSYPMTSTPQEDFAETIALYISKKAGSTKGICISNFKTQYPKHWQFARNNIFFENLGW